MAAEEPRPSPQLKRLDIFEGRWNTRGKIIDDGSDFTATDIYEWMPGGFFMIHHVETDIAGQPAQALEMIGADPGGDGYLSWSFDIGGGTATYTASLEGKSWSIEGKAERFRGSFNTRGSELQGRWEQNRDGAWHPWMDIVLTRQS